MTTSALMLSMLLALSANAGQEISGDIGIYLASIADRDIPVEVVELKAREGLSKGVPPDRIQPILERLVENLEVAQQVHQDGDDELLAATASALRSGASIAALEALREVPDEARVRATETLSDLIRMKFTERDALRLTLQAGRASDANASLIGVTGAAGSLVRAGIPAPVAAQQINIAMDTAGNARDIVNEPRGKAYGHDKGNGPADPKGKDK